MWEGRLEKVDNFRWMINKDYKKCMNVPGIIYASEKLLESIKKDNAPEQVANVACLPGIEKYSIAMPDIHWGYGFPIGGVAAFSIEEGVISPGGVGYDINCGVRILKTNLKRKDIERHLEKILNEMFLNIPAGVGKGGIYRVGERDLKDVLALGARWVVEKGFGWKEDLERIEEGGSMKGADPSKVSSRAIQRGLPQLGSLGAGNHFMEIQVVERVFDREAAKAIGIEEDTVTVMVHTGSRGLGHQVCDDYVRQLQNAMGKYGINVPDRQLASVPFKSPEGQAYFGAMVCAANFAWANRQFITHWIRESFEKAIGESAERLGMQIIYDVAHNIAKIEDHMVNGKLKKVVVHRKGATRAFPKGHPQTPQLYHEIGQPVLIPGDMGTASYILLGTQKAMEETFGSTAHGAGRVLSRSEAVRRTKGRNIVDELKKKGILVKVHSLETLSEEVPDAYKDVDIVVDVVHNAGISTKVARMVPIAVIKG
ncbi:MAG TPA: RtcB family protein [Candidatus Hydrothermia bacterium]|nr:RtcB family protein [Candidatus Hydrothermae bacterium]MDD3649300.1 RtcB family protein [Candidatus Hydrothermia bacterium]HOK22715.1 RtcB family protein [Candidatus Hydrothermia bacterium]HOL23424.1 RtcB family protein [Candidatus Hydrothermia bacterium]HOP32449.1 RtcB family protein [Candidatus Hydrothermia bacterium]